MSDDFISQSQFPSTFRQQKRSSKEVSSLTSKRQKLAPDNSVKITIPEPFFFRTESRGRQSTYKSFEQKEIEYLSNIPKFKAKPSPFVVDKENIRPHPCAPKPPDAFRARPVPSMHSVFTPSLKPFEPTVPQPPNLETTMRGYWKEAQFADMVLDKEKAESEKKIFRARSMPRFAEPHSVSTAHSHTLVKPFQFSSFPKKSCQRSASTQVFKFKAKPMPDFSRPFVPSLPNKNTSFNEFSLFSSDRAIQRNAFDHALQDINRCGHIRRETERIEQQKREQEELRAYRKNLEFKAQPLPSGKAFELKRTEIELTVPESPHLHTKERSRLKSIFGDTSQIEDIEMGE